MNRTYNQEISALKQYCELVELYDENAKIAISPSLQGRVLTSCTSGDLPGFGWINHELIKSGKQQPHINAYGGEDRFWIGPEAGQFAIFFKPGDALDFNNWQTPACIDSEPFHIVNQTDNSVNLVKNCKLKNYQGTDFLIEINRNISIFSRTVVQEMLPNIDLSKVASVAYKSENKLVNKALDTWRKETGLLNIWILGKFKPSKKCWAIIPNNPNAYINQNYFEADFSNRLIKTTDFALMLVDGHQKAKIGIAPQHDKNVLGSFDFENNVLTIVAYKTDKNQVFLNSEWNIQEHPYAGDVLNVYNDGPNPDGSILGPYYELETSSSSKELKSGEAISHSHSTYHFTGSFDALNAIAKTLLFVDLNTIKQTVHA